MMAEEPWALLGKVRILPSSSSVRSIAFRQSAVEVMIQNIQTRVSEWPPRKGHDDYPSYLSIHWSLVSYLYVVRITMVLTMYSFQAMLSQYSRPNCRSVRFLRCEYPFPICFFLHDEHLELPPDAPLRGVVSLTKTTRLYFITSDHSPQFNCFISPFDADSFLSIVHLVSSQRHLHK